MLDISIECYIYIGNYQQNMQIDFDMSFIAHKCNVILYRKYELSPKTILNIFVKKIFIFLLF